MKRQSPTRTVFASSANLHCSLEFALFSKEPLYPELETLKLTNSLTWLAEQMGTGKDKLVEQVLARKSPATRAAELISGTSLGTVSERKRLYEGGKKAIAESKDPMILFAKLVDGPARAYRKTVETQSEIKSQAYERIAKAKFAIEGR